MRPGARPRPWMHQTEHLVSDVSTYIDETVLNAELSGILLALATLWAVVLFNRLWQASLRRDAEEAIAAAQERGLQLEPPGLRAQLAAVGNVGSEPVRVVWRGGWLGARTILRCGSDRQRLPLLRTAAELEAALAGTG